MTSEEITEGLRLLEDNMVYFDELLNDKGEYIDVHELLFEAIEALEQEPCEDAISRKDAINAIKRTVATEQIKELKRLPSVQPKPKTGHWIEDDMTYCGVELVNYKCDKCGEMGGAWRKGLKPDKLPKYCMNCGAKMLPTDRFRKGVRI